METGNAPQWGGMVGPELEVSLQRAFTAARQARHEFVTVELLLLSLLDNAAAAEALRGCACDISALRKTLQEFIALHVPVAAPGAATETALSLGFERVLQRTTTRAASDSRRDSKATGARALIAIFAEMDSPAVYFLHQHGVTRLDLVNAGESAVGKPPRDDTFAPQPVVAAAPLELHSAAPEPTTQEDIQGTLAPELEETLRKTYGDALQARHQFVVVEHLLLGLLDDAAAGAILRATARDVDELRANLRAFIDDNTPLIPPDSAATTAMTLGFHRVIQRAFMQVRSSPGGARPVTGVDLLAAIFGEADSHAVYYLSRQGVEPPNPSP